MDAPAPGPDLMLLRPLAPTGALGVGDPPVSAHAVVSAPRRRGEEATAAAQRAFPWLSAEQVGAALAQAELDPAPLTPRLTPGQALSLGLVLGMGMLFNAMGVVGLAGVGWLLLMSNFVERPDIAAALPDAPMVVVMFVGAVAYFFVGVELRRLQRWARFGGALLAGLLCVVPVLLGHDETPNGFTVATCLCAQLLMLSAAGRWTTDEGRAAARAAPTQAYVQVVAWAWLIVVALLAFVPAFHRMFKEVGLTLPYGTIAVLNLADLVASYQLLVPPALLALSLPLLRLRSRHERPATWAAAVAGFAALGSIMGWLLLPVIELLQKL